MILESGLLDFSKIGRPQLKSRMLTAIGGLRGTRVNALSRRSIEKIFRSTPHEFVRECLWELIDEEKVRPCRNGLSDRAGTVYERCK